MLVLYLCCEQNNESLAKMLVISPSCNLKRSGSACIRHLPIALVPMVLNGVFLTARFLFQSQKQ